MKKSCATRSNFVFTNMYFFYTLCFFLLVGVSFIDSAKILAIFPIPAKSHFTSNNNIMKPLLNAGHEITVITSFSSDASKLNYSQIIDVSQHARNAIGVSQFMEYIKMSSYRMMFNAISLEQSLCDKVMKLKEIQDVMNSEEKLYDIVFVEMFVLDKCFTFVAQKLGIPIIGTVTLKMWLYADWAIDNPIYPSYMPLDMVSSWQYDSFYHRLINTYHYVMMKYFWYFNVIPFLRKFYQENLQQVMSYSEFMTKEPDFLFYDTHPVFYPRPMNPNVQQIGGIQMEPAKPLPENIQKFIDEAEHGVILFSFGSVIRTSSVTPQMIETFRDALAQLPQRVIWKFEDDLENPPKNMLLLKWLPQRDILEHKNVIAFISHCGRGGTYEAIHTGTPIISCSLFGDQPSNAALLEHLEVAVHLDIHSITKESIINAINTLLNNTKYRDNMRKLSREFKDLPMTPQQSVVYWTEYIIRHNGAQHLKTAASQLNWFQYLLLDVLVFLILSIFVVSYLIYRSMKIIHQSVLQILSFNKVHKNKSD